MAKVTEAYLEARREEILEAAIACFARNGFHQTTMADIAGEAGISPGAIYRYFASKEDVIKASVQARSGVRAAMFQALAEKDNTLEALDLLVDLYMTRIDRAEPEIALFVQLYGEGLRNPEVRESVLARWNEVITGIADLIHLGQARGEINPALKPKDVALLFVAAVAGLMVHKTLDPEVDVWKFAEVFMALCGGDFWRGASRGSGGDGQHPVSLHSQASGGSSDSSAFSERSLAE
jgi:AcrR family transcriptional regulator